MISRKSIYLLVFLVLALAAIVPLILRAADVIIDSTVYTTATTHNGTTFTTVFVSDTTGYTFYRDSDGTCRYSKSIDQGNTWSAGVTVHNITNCLRIAVWYDQWTSGNSGSYIHIATIDNANPSNVYYIRLDTSNDTLSSPVVVATSGGRFTAGATLETITRATDGTLYEGALSSRGSVSVKCSSNCTVATSWTLAGTASTVFGNANNWLLLMPLPSANVLGVMFNLNSNIVESKVWHAASSSWDGSWATIDSNCPDNTTYDGHFGSTINKISGSIYMAYGCNLATLTSGTGAIRTAVYNGSWTAGANAETNSPLGITGVKVGLDANTGNLYVVYSGQVTPGTAGTANVYYRVSTSSMATWGTRLGPLNSAATDIYGLRIDGMNSQRMYATWVDGVNYALHGNTVSMLTPTTYAQSGYRFFADANSLTPGAAYSSVDTSSTILQAGNAFRLRMLVGVSGDGVDINGGTFKLQVATGTPGLCSASQTNYTDVSTSTGDIRFYNNTNASAYDGATLLATADDPYDGSNVIVNQTYEEANPFSNSQAKIFGSEDGQWDFSLINALGAPGTTYCFRIVKNDGSLLNNYSYMPEATVDSAPSVQSVVVNNNQSIALIENTQTQVPVTVVASDPDGGGDLNGPEFTGRLYRSGVGPNCSTNDNNCYDLHYLCYPSSCSSSSTCTFGCYASMNYFADPTDQGTPWASEDWEASVSAVDQLGVTSTAVNSTGGVDVLSLLALHVSQTVPYGNLSVGQKIDPISKIITVSSTGNVSIDTTVYGTDMSAGSNSIPLASEHYATSAVSFAAAKPLASSPGTFLDLNIPKTTSTNAASTVVYWGISIPSVQPTGNYSGSVTFIANTNELPWP